MADAGIKSKHDIVITDPSTGYKVGFNVDRTRDGKIAYAEYSGKALADYVSNSNVTQVSTNPEEEFIIGQNLWSNGFGKKYMGADTKQYDISVGMDLSYEDRAMLSNASTTITVPSFLGITDMGMELWTDANTLTNWTYSETAANWQLDRETGTKDAGTYSAKISNPGGAAGGSYGQCLQAAVTWSDDFRAKTFACTVKVYNTDITKVKGQLIMTDGVDTTTANSAGTGSWETVTCLHKLNAAATKLEVIFRALAVDGNASSTFFDTMYFPENNLWGTSDVVYSCKGVEFDSDLFVAHGKHLLRMNTSGTWSFQAGFPHEITNLVKFTVSSADYLFIFQGVSWPCYYMNTSEVFLLSTAATNTFQYGAWVNTTADTFYANSTTSGIRSTTNPLNGGVAWSAVTQVGSADKIITGLYEQDGALLIEKQDMPYYLDSTGVVQKDLAPECKNGDSTDSGKCSAIWNGEYFRPTGTAGLLRIGTTNEWISPSDFTSVGMYITDTVFGVAGDDKFLYAVVYSDPYCEILRGREIYDEDNGYYRWVWHTYQRITLAGTTSNTLGAVWISNVYRKRLYIGQYYRNLTSKLYYIDLPNKYGSGESDTNVNFLTGGYFETPWLHGDFPSTQKGLISLTCTMGHTYNAGRYFNVNYKKLGDSSWSATTLKFDGSASSMVETNYFEVPATSRSSTMIKLKFTGVTDSTSYTPILLDYKLKCVLYPTPKKIMYASLVCSRESVDLNGTPTSLYELQKSCIAHCYDATFPFLMTEYLTDKHGVSYYIKFLPVTNGNPYTKILDKEQGHDANLKYNVLMLHVPLS